jgi:RimJ/RimL family protein N-acetyltransferase
MVRMNINRTYDLQARVKSGKAAAAECREYRPGLAFWAMLGEDSLDDFVANPGTNQMLAPPPDDLSFDRVRVKFIGVMAGDTPRGLVPYYHFRILTGGDTEAGHINFRVGDTEHVRLYAGHIGFVISEAFRGRRLAYQACRAIAPFVRSIQRAVIITCDPDNYPSRRTIERLGARFIDEVAVPPHDPQYQRGTRSKRRYEWTP